ncbi:MAG: hypothetical protein QXP72_01125 [Desulfurococcaceae archaeon]
MFIGLVKSSIVLSFIILFIHMVYPLITFTQYIVQDPSGSFNIVVNEIRKSLDNQELVMINATLIYDVPVTLKDFKITICGSNVVFNELKPGNYTLILIINTSMCGFDTIDLSIDFKIEGIYRVNMVVVNWLK